MAWRTICGMAQNQHQNTITLWLNSVISLFLRLKNDYFDVSRNVIYNLKTEHDIA